MQLGCEITIPEERIRIGTEGGLGEGQLIVPCPSLWWFFSLILTLKLISSPQSWRSRWQEHSALDIDETAKWFKERSAPQNDSSHPPLIQTSPIASWNLSVQAKSALQLTVNFWVAAVWKVPWAFISQLVRRHELCNVTTPLCLISSQLRYTHKSLPLVASCWRIAPLRWIFAHLYSILFSSTDWGKGHK